MTTRRRPIGSPPPELIPTATTNTAFRSRVLTHIDGTAHTPKTPAAVIHRPAVRSSVTSWICLTIRGMPDVPRPELLEILTDLSDLLDDLDRGRLTRYLRTPSAPVDPEATIDVLSAAAYDLDAIAEDLTSPAWGHPTPEHPTPPPPSSLLTYRRPHS